jgi:glycosyltransferase involved in cell wall biosynthesis
MPEKAPGVRRLFYAVGPGEVVAHYRHWRTGDEGLGQTSRTFSGQFFQLCRQRGYQAYAISSFKKADIERDELIIAENRPKRRFGKGAFAYHVSQILYGLSIVHTAIRWRADYVLVDSGTTHWALLAILRLFNIPVGAVLHNVPWPQGRKPRDLARRIILRTDGWFWRRAANAVISVSPECERQVIELAGVFGGAALQCRAQFRRDDFDQISPPLPVSARPFRIVFAGRVERDKGVFDLIEIARRVDGKYPGQTLFDVCGGGSAFEELRTAVEAAGVGHILLLHGRLNRPDLLKIYSQSQVFIVPTKSTFCEGMPMVCAEAVLSGRPLITSPITNATDVLDGAILLAETDDPGSYAEKIGLLLENPQLYEQLRAACPRLREQFYETRNSLTAVIGEAVDSYAALRDAGATANP